MLYRILERNADFWVLSQEPSQKILWSAAASCLKPGKTGDKGKGSNILRWWGFKMVARDPQVEGRGRAGVEDRCRKGSCEITKAGFYGGSQ